MLNQTFVALIEDQFVYGGKKYANSNTKEATDILVDDYGLNWLLGTVNKYVYRYGNQGIEKDLLKISCYMYILFLKLGFHLSAIGTSNDNYTTVDTKSKFFSTFVEEVNTHTLGADTPTDKKQILDLIAETLKEMRVRANLTKDRLFSIIHLAERIWVADGFATAEQHNTDTWNAKK